jgi:NAD(P)-dependent dehydrogenase (short-subunit alcohol dehydrogenase family)
VGAQPVILVTGYFLVSRAAFRIMKQQQLGGSMVYVASKNGLVASGGASAYCTAKAAEIHLARCLALEGAPHGIRVNVVNPTPSSVARASGMASGRKSGPPRTRSARTISRNFTANAACSNAACLPEDIAEAVYFPRQRKSGQEHRQYLNVDAGNAAAFTR